MSFTPTPGATPSSPFGTPTPSSPAPSTSSSTATSLASFKRPPSPSLLATLTRTNKMSRQRRAKVLDEDEYVEKVSEIIKKDYFPELEKLEAQTEYLEASERKDYATMNRLRERFSSTEPVKHQNREGSPDTFETPQEERREEEEEPKEKTKEGEEKTEGEEEKKKVSLDRFLANHTSEDNESFNDLIEDTNAKFRQTHAWMFKEDEVKSIELKRDQLSLPSIEMQSEAAANPVGKSLKLDGWTYKNENAVFYAPDGVDATPQELVERAKKERKIVMENTRFGKNPWKKDLQETSLKETLHTKKEKEAGKVGVDGKAYVRPETPKVGGFKFLRMTPSPMPGANSESPMMTWGEVDSTPYRLEGCETPLPMSTAGGPSFSIQDIPKRDRLAHELAEKNSKFYRDKKGKAVSNARSHIKTPKLNMTSRVATMSPAAQRLATTKLGIRLGTDKALRASYTPSPARRASSSTPSSSRKLISSSVRSKSGGGMTPKTPRGSATPSSAAAYAASMTDNLLKLPKKKSETVTSVNASRQKASDFL